MVEEDGVESPRLKHGRPHQLGVPGDGHEARRHLAPQRRAAAGGTHISTERRRTRNPTN
jgi:hypothetical protein